MAGAERNEDTDGKYYKIRFSVAKDNPPHLAYGMGKIKDASLQTKNSRWGSEAINEASNTYYAQTSENVKGENKIKQQAGTAGESPENQPVAGEAFKDPQSGSNYTPNEATVNSKNKNSRKLNPYAPWSLTEEQRAARQQTQTEVPAAVQTQTAPPSLVSQYAGQEISNSRATAILNDTASVAEMTEAGVDLSGTASQRRAAVKEYVAGLESQAQTTTEVQQEQSQPQQIAQTQASPPQQEVETAQEAYARYDSNTRKFVDRVRAFVKEAIAKKGQTLYKQNKFPLWELPSTMVDALNKASGGEVDATGKKFVLDAGQISHEYQNHSNVDTETSRGQIALTEDSIADVVRVLSEPDMIEYISGPNNKNGQKASFFFVKQVDGHRMVVESVGGKNNKNIDTTAIWQFRNDVWEDMIANGKSIAEIVYKDGYKLGITSEQGQKNKANRITVAAHVPLENLARTSETLPQALPLASDIKVTQPKAEVNSQSLPNGGNVEQQAAQPLPPGPGLQQTQQTPQPLPPGPNAQTEQQTLPPGPDAKRPASLRQRAEQNRGAPDMESRTESAKNAPKEAAEMLRNEDDGIIETDVGDLSTVAQDLKGNGSFMNLDIYRVLDKVAGKNKKLRQFLHNAIEKPLNNAKNKYARNVVDRMNSYKSEMDRLGIKAGSKESAAVQWIGEGRRQIDNEGHTTEYTLEQLKQDFPDSWGAACWWQGRHRGRIAAAKNHFKNELGKNGLFH